MGFNRDRSSTGQTHQFTYDANSNRLTSIDKTTSDTDLDGGFDADDFGQTNREGSTQGRPVMRLERFTWS